MQVFVGFASVARCFLVVAVSCLFASSALTQPVNECAEAAALWLPSDVTPVKAVTKWSKQQEVKFAIFSQEKNSSTVGFTESELNFVSRQTGLKMVELDQSKANLPDLLVVIDPSVTNDEGMLRELAQRFFASKLNRSFNIDADTWAANVRNISPKCFALNIEINDEKNVGFLMIQESEKPPCILVGLSETFGVIGARNYHAAAGGTISEAIIGKSLQQLYSETIRSGMSRTEALNQVQKDCEKQR